jgi:hypothetical protein
MISTTAPSPDGSWYIRLPAGIPVFRYPFSLRTGNAGENDQIEKDPAIILFLIS